MAQPANSNRTRTRPRTNKKKVLKNNTTLGKCIVYTGNFVDYKKFCGIYYGNLKIFDFLVCLYSFGNGILWVKLHLPGIYGLFLVVGVVGSLSSEKYLHVTLVCASVILGAN
jgi:hypothetical protein